MNIDININSEDFKRQVEKSILKSDIFESTIEEILGRDEIQELITNKIKEILQSGEMTSVICEKIKEYIENYDISYDDDITEVMDEQIKSFIKSKFEEK